MVHNDFPARQKWFEGASRSVSRHQRSPNLSSAQEETQRLATILETGQMLAGTIQLKDAMSVCWQYWVDTTDDAWRGDAA